MNTRIRILATSVLALSTLMLVAVAHAAEPVVSLPLPGVGTVDITNTVEVTFDHPGDWEIYSNRSGAELDVENGVYRAYTPTSGYLWGLNAQEHSDVVAEVQVTPMTIFQDVAAGIVCRADPSDNGDGYYFMISPGGYYSVQKAQGDDFTALVDWQPSRAIHDGLDQNTIRAACVGDQLSMYVNGELVATARDETFSRGYAGLAVAAGDNSVDMAFDNVTLYSVENP